MSIKRKIGVVLLAALTLAAISTGIVTARNDDWEVRGESVTIASGQTHDGSLYAAGSTVTIDGTVKGDVYCATQAVTINGTVEGDVICAAQNARVAGTVRGDVRIAGQSVTLNGTVEGVATVFAQSADIGKDAVINQDLNGAASTSVLSGKVGRDVLLSSSVMTIDGTVGRNVGGYYDQLTVANGAAITGALRYTSDEDATVANGTVQGEVVRSEPQRENRDWNGEEFAAGAAVYFFASMLLIALVLALLLPRLIHTVTDNGVKRLLQSLLTGFFFVFGLPFVLFLLAITVIGIPLAGVLFVAWLLVLLLSGPVFAYYLGRVILQNRSTNPLLIMLVGSVVLLLAYFIPVANIIAFFAAAIIGSGMIALSLAGRYQKPSYKLEGETA